jgi:hypothetical protein
MMDGCEGTARVEIEGPAPLGANEFVLYEAGAIGGFGAELARETNQAGTFAADVNPGCYVVTVAQIGGPATGFEDPTSNQPAFCLGSGETRVIELGPLAPISAGRNIHNGLVVDPDGNPVAGVTVDFFAPPPGLTPNQVRLLDHSMEDYRDRFDGSATTGADGRWVRSEFASLCFIQTLTAPTGFTWPNGTIYLNRSSCGSERTTVVAYPTGADRAPSGRIDLKLPDGLIPAGGSTTAELVDLGSGQQAQWFRIVFGADFESRNEVPAGCYQLRLGLRAGAIWTASGRAVQLDGPFCVEPGATTTVVPAGETRVVDYDSSQPFLTGEFIVDEDAADPVPGVAVELYYPLNGLTDDDLRATDHLTRDVRGPLATSVASDTDGKWAAPTYLSCMVATFIAPDGQAFDTGTFKTVTVCQGDVPPLATLTG